jgi:hypothetical protein
MPGGDLAADAVEHEALAGGGRPTERLPNERASHGAASEAGGLRERSSPNRKVRLARKWTISRSGAPDVLGLRRPWPARRGRRTTLTRELITGCGCPRLGKRRVPFGNAGTPALPSSSTRSSLDVGPCSSCNAGIWASTATPPCTRMRKRGLTVGACAVLVGRWTGRTLGRIAGRRPLRWIREASSVGLLARSRRWPPHPALWAYRARRR